jgi:hypothetical protein
MRILGFTGIMLSALMITALIYFSTFFIAPPVFAATATAPPDYISVPQGGVFLLRGSVTLDVPNTQGYWIWGPVYWYSNGDPTENFCLENTPSVYWTSGGTGVGNPVENISISDYSVGGNIGWQVVIGDDGNGLAVDGTFNVDIWLRAASRNGTPHRPGNHEIYFELNQITMFEPSAVTAPAGPIEVQVTNIVKLENLYMTNLEKDLKLYAGSKLVVKFYKYDNTFQAESAIDNISPPYPYFIKENENVQHPLGVPVEKVALVLTTDNTDNEISTIASFTVLQSDLRNRYIAILTAWAGNPGQQSAFRAEIINILRQWPGAPT